MEYNGFPVVRGRGMVKWNPFASIPEQYEEEEIHISYYRDGMVQDMYINVLHIEPMTKTIYCTDAFGLNTKFKFDELVNIN
ncbi:YolD-like family protein [Bacillus cereus]|uniref:YolD-like family protein n=1 Tax=Bacillus cereus TaxID=1396 RepID=UPI003BF49099